MMMEFGMWLCLLTGVFGVIATFLGCLKRANEWIYVSCLGEKKHTLPPGDLGWPLIGTMLSFFKAFMYDHPDSFISSFATRYGNTEIYKALMFGNPTVIVTTPEACKLVLMDDQRFGPGWPISVKKVMGKKGMHDVTIEEQKRIHRLTASPLTGHEALNVFVEQIKTIVTSSLEEWDTMKEPIEFLIEVKKIAFKVMMDVLISSDTDPRLEALEKEYAVLNDGVISMPINLPGFACFRAIQARKKLVKIFGEILNERKVMVKSNNESRRKKDMLALMMEAEDDNGGKLSDEEIVDLLIIYLYAGHESSALATMWVLMLLEQHPQVFQKAKEEQEAIRKRRPSSQDGVSLKEVREMKYASKVIDETLRLINVAFTLFREARCDIEIDGYTIPKGWKVLAWIRSIHMDEKLYPNPKEFNPSRWDDHVAKAGTYIPFGAGSRFCPGRDLARLEISIFLHYYLLDYKFERVNPGCKIKYLPLTAPVDNCLARIKKVSPLST